MWLAYYVAREKGFTVVGTHAIIRSLLLLNNMPVDQNEIKPVVYYDFLAASLCCKRS